MCSLCWNQPFCFDEKRPAGQQIYRTGAAGLPCDDPGDQAFDASRLVDALAPREGGFYCWKPFPDAVVNHPDKVCPTDESGRSKVENLDVCQDVPPCGQPPAQCGVPASNPSCLEVSPIRPSACVAVPGYDDNALLNDRVNGADAMVHALVRLCTRYDATPPSGAAPERYCYLACVDAAKCTLEPADERECNGCTGVR
jgi:hypothetical protein